MIDFDDVGFTYDGHTLALDGVTLDVGPGQFVCVLGGNGSGKSTLAKHVDALLIPDTGVVRVDGMDTSDAKNTYAVRATAGMVFQNPDDQLVASLVEDDVAFGPENLGVPSEEIRQRVTEALAQVGLKGYERRQTSALSGGQKQRVAIAGALAMRPKVLVLDEASAMLDPAGRDALLDACVRLNRDGLTVVMITHFMEEAALADEVFVLRGGRLVAQGSPEAVLTSEDTLSQTDLDAPFATELSRLLRDRGIPVGLHVKDDDLADDLTSYFSRELGGLSPAPQEEDATGVLKAFADARQAARDAAHVAEESTGGSIELRHVWHTYDPLTKRQRRALTARGLAQDGATVTTDADGDNDGGDERPVRWALSDVSLMLPAGSFLGVAGHTGSGKSTLVQHLNGLMQPTFGQVVVGGVDLADPKRATEARRSVGVVFQYPETQLFAATVAEDVAFGPKNMGLDDNAAAKRAAEALELMGMDPDECGGKSPFELSGGQQRRVAFAGVLAMRPSTLVMDEPCAGLDPKGRDELLRLIAGLHDRLGITVVMVSHSMDDLARLCDRVLVLDDGKVVAYDTPEKVFRTENGPALRRIGLDLPRAQRMAETLRRAGVPVPQGRLYDVDGLADALVGVNVQGRHAAKGRAE